ncbi:hypothetical protein [Micromonospora rubida]|uniref:hypothetical protein n=1 Tax=Micromonospora rubida TaxID=2697657 RepID=UPI001378CF00|nr:hypothetical protein [Micromonospora rubida]NBE83384.1 hypothetical protein [Micromonospora rubida]
MIRRVGVALAALQVAVVILVAPAPASAAPLPVGQCTTTSGVILAVDFRRWGGPLTRSCGTTPTTGYELLNQGGWKTTGTQHDGPAFICRIGYAGFDNGTRYPTAADEKCILTPPASAYWSYWHADPGSNAWQYSQLGAMSYRPKPGSVDLWIFGGTNIGGTEGLPTFSPDSVRAHNATPVATGPPAAGPKPPVPAPGQPSRPGATATPPGGPRPSAGGTVTPSAAAATASVTGSPSAAPSAVPSGDGAGDQAAEGPTVVDAAPTRAATTNDRGSAGPLVVTLGAVVLLGIAGFVLARRRGRRTGVDADAAGPQ